MDLTKLTPRQIDTKLAELHAELSEAQEAAARASVLFARFDKSRVENMSAYERETYESIAKDYDDTTARVAAARTNMEPYKAEYNARPWSRFFAVPEGHVHASMKCSTCNNGKRRTEFTWLPELSGKTEADAVASQGAYLCSVCFPSAPTEWTDGRERDAAAKAATKCAGSGQRFDPALPHRTGYASGNSAQCHMCGASVALTTGLLLRAHKPAA